MKLASEYDIGEIYKAYYKDIYRYILILVQNKEMTEDVVQNTFLKAMRGIKNFRGDCTIKTWLITIARNEIIQYKQKEKTHLALEDIPEIFIPDNMFNNQCDHEMTTSILKYIEVLEEPKKSLMVLRLVNESSFVEIGYVLKKSDTWCRVTFMRIKNNMLKDLEGLL